MQQYSANSFFNKLLNAAEKNYWSTELEVAGLVWLVKKARHLLDGGSRRKVVTIFIDYSAATFIARQTDFNTASVEKLNLQLIWASQYLSQFNLKVIYWPEKIHLVPNTLSRLLRSMKKFFTSTLDDLIIEEGDTEAFSAVLIEISSEFKNQIIEKYREEMQ